MRTCNIQEFVAFLSEPIVEGLADYLPFTDFTDALASIKANIYERIKATTEHEWLVLIAASVAIARDEHLKLLRQASISLENIEPLRYKISTVAPSAHIAARRR